MELLNNSSSEYKTLASDVTEAIEKVLDAKNSSSKVQVMEFKPGSVLAFLNISTDKPETDVKQTLQNQMLSGKIGALNVSKTLFSGTLFDVVLKIKAECNDAFKLEGVNQRGNLTLEVQHALRDNETVTVQKVACPDPGNVTIVTVRVQDDNSPTGNPNKELESLQEQVKKGQLGNFTLIPEWEAYIPGEKVFSVSFNLATPSQNRSATIQDLEIAIKNIFKNDTDYKYVTVELLEDNKTAIVKVGMKTVAPGQPNEALKPMKPLKDSVSQGILGESSVEKNSFNAYINPNTLTRKEFRIRFRLNMSDCDIANASKRQDLVVDYINRLKKYKYFIEAKLQTDKLECVNGNYYKNQRFVQAWFLVYVSPAAPDSRGQFNRYLFICDKDGKGPNTYDGGVLAVTLTPTSPEISVGDSTHYVCRKPKPPKPTYTTTPSITPSKEPVSSGTPPTEQKPSLYVKVKLGITWGEFCSKLEHSLKQKIAWNLYDKNGTRVSPDRIMFINVEKNCADPSKKDEQAEVWFYVSKSGSKKLHKCLTLKAYKLLKMFLENGNTKPLGPDFEGKVIILFCFATFLQLYIRLTSDNMFQNVKINT